MNEIFFKLKIYLGIITFYLFATIFANMITVSNAFSNNFHYLKMGLSLNLTILKIIFNYLLALINETYIYVLSIIKNFYKTFKLYKIGKKNRLKYNKGKLNLLFY
jgi:hypothetical protein